LRDVDEPASIAPRLDYAPAEPVRRRRRWRRFLYAVMLLAAGAALWRAGPPFARQVRYVYWQSRCMSFTAPVGMVAYEEDTTRAPTLLVHPGYAKVMASRGSGATGFTGFTPPPLAALGTGSVAGQCAPFLGERTTPGTRRGRLALVSCAPLSYGGGGRAGRIVEMTGAGLVPATLLPGSEGSLQTRARLHFVLRSDHVLRVFCGQSDPAHADHLTIKYELDGQPGMIDGWLKDDGRVELKVRDGPATRFWSPLPY
jgi:hypothetical protein